MGKKKRKAAYANILGGKLNLNGGALPTKGGSKKKRKKKRRKKYEEEFEKFYAERKQAAQKNEEVVPDMRTKAEKQADHVATARQASLIQDSIQMTHRQKIEKFNNYLGNLSEHYDIPRVGPG